MFNQSQINNFTIAQGQRNVFETVFQGKIPHKIVFAFVSLQRCNGSYSLNPFEFILYNANTMSVLINDVCMPYRPLEMNFQKSHFTLALCNVLREHPKDTRAQGKYFILVLDDLQQVCEKDREVAEVFTVGSHPLNFTLIYLCHNIFSKGCFSRAIHPNSHYNILFRNNRHITSSNSWISDIWETVSYFMDAYIKATSLPWDYILINLHPKARKNTYKLITHIIPGEMTII